ncbi:hypothetical protein [Variovorax sp. RA8]|uniref:hypothetical protein n=1 Tax=Variovorax sp. (strain JCM 16519 / RA8) TaxID=662548 RepID=UPI001316FB8C|nr:hypothetical protein [Variovorax sp. RA8]VTU42943.1 hypothetical protein RA8P1_00360 [Variovorax sp. RA8]
MTKTSRSSVIGTRVSTDKRARIAALAAHHQLSESGLLAKLIDEVLQANDAPVQQAGGQRLDRMSTIDGVREDRVTLRLRHGDRMLAAERACARGMKTGSYLAMLVHNHVRSSAVLPPNELDLLKATGAQLAALGRQLQRFGMPNMLADPLAYELRDAISAARREIEAAREATAAVVRRNLVSWETGGEIGHA